MGDSYVSIYFSEAQRTCHEYPWYDQTLMQFLKDLTYTIINLLVLICILFQIFEWVAVIFIIQTQKNKSLD